MAMPVLGQDTGGDYGSRYGHTFEEGLLMPAIGHFAAMGRYTAAATAQGDTLIQQERPLYTQAPLIEYDEQSRIKTFHPATGAGYMMFGPMELQPYLFYGDNTNHSPRPGAVLPKSISKTGLAVLSFMRNNTGHGDSPSGFFGWGVAHPTGLYPADGWIAHLGGNAGARNLILAATDYSGALDSTCSKRVEIQNGLYVGCDLEVAGEITDGLTEDITTVGAGPGSFTAVDMGTLGGMFSYEVVGWNNTDGETISGEGVITVEGGALLAVNHSTESHAGCVSAGVAGGLVTVTVLNGRTASDSTNWTLKYRTLIRGV